MKARVARREKSAVQSRAHTHKNCAHFFSFLHEIDPAHGRGKDAVLLGKGFYRQTY